MANCPHCRTIQAGFTCIQTFEYQEEFEQAGKRYARIVRNGFLKCPVCNHAVIGVAKDGKVSYTPSTELDVPEHLPPNVEKFLRQGLENVHRNFDAAGMMFRKALEIGLKEKYPELKDSLYKNIEKLAKDNALTNDLAEWAHHIRFAGNDAAHDETFTEAEAKEMQHFTELVLTYIFSLPEKVKAHSVANQPD
ncbi:MAG: DUF4145 domain-containing protein [Thalassospira sp.]|uniref:DUF4145 domain-containing protein n=1 Tax=Thalassospira sp. TaxID=1912094 RepID=UPI003A8812AE